MVLFQLECFSGLDKIKHEYLKKAKKKYIKEKKQSRVLN